MRAPMLKMLGLALAVLTNSYAAAKSSNLEGCTPVSTITVAAPPTTVTVTFTDTKTSNLVQNALEATADVTIYNTVFETRILSVEQVTHTPSVNEKIVIPPPGTAYAYTGLALGGWNGSRLTKLSPAPTATLPPTFHQNGSTTLLKRLKKKDVLPEWITATLDGQVVSWENHYTPQAEAASSTVFSSVGVLLENSNSAQVHSAASVPSKIIEPALSSTSTPSQIVSSCKSSSTPFTIDFDDLPHFTISSAPEDSNVPPILNPYRKFYFDSHFGYVPPPSDPYPPHSPPELAIYRAAGTGSDGSGNVDTMDDALAMPGEFGAGPHASSNAYWFNPLSGFFGCADGSLNPCVLTIRGYIGSEPKQPSVAQAVYVAPCPDLKNCQLVKVELRDDFRALTAMQISAAVGETALDYYMDDFEVEWYNSTCAAQAVRASAE